MESDAFFTFRPSPDAGMRELMASIEGGAEGLQELRRRRVLVDLTGLANPPSEVESLLLSHHVGSYLGNLERIAVVVPERTGLGERVARHLGARMTVFTSADEASRWLSAEAVDD